MNLNCFKPSLFLFIFFFFFNCFSPSVSFTFLPANNAILCGDASLINNSITLTQQHNCTSLPPPYTVGVGRAFYANPIRFLDVSTNASASFLCSFSFTIMHSPSCPYGDGLAFFITSNTDSFSLTDGYRGLRKQGSHSEDSFVAVEFDTSHNPILEDINDNYIAIDVSKQVDVKDGKEMSAWIEYSASENMIRVWLSTSSQIRPTNPVLAARADLSKQFKEFMYMGFSASNGNGSATHKIEKWRFRTFGIHSSAETFDEDGNSMVSFAVDDAIVTYNASASSASPDSSGVPITKWVTLVLVINFLLLICLRYWQMRRHPRARFLPRYEILRYVYHGTRDFVEFVIGNPTNPLD